MSEFEKRFPKPCLDNHLSLDNYHKALQHWRDKREGWLEALRWANSMLNLGYPNLLTDEIEEIEKE